MSNITQEHLDWLRLIRTQNIGPITFYQLVAHFGNAAEALRQAPDFAKAKGRKKPFILPDDKSIKEELFLLQKHGANMLIREDAAYPHNLAQIKDAPPVLFYLGDISLAKDNAVAIVGTRNASAIGLRMAQNIAQGLGEQNYSVVSGLARGIDTAAHKASLQTGTIAVVAGGVDNIYPPENEELRAQIMEYGCVISEMPMGYEPTNRDFPKRNRLISGLCKAVTVVEAAAKSGTLITARQALTQNRDIFVVPGSPLDPRYEGANRLIQNGAILVQQADEIIDHLNGFKGNSLFDEPDPYQQHNEIATAMELMDDPSARDLVKSMLTFAPIHRDDLIAAINDQAEIDAAIISAILLDLVLIGEAEESSGGYYSLI